MKVEAGESLILSWLRHVRQCQIVQMNWKASGRWPVHEKERLGAFVSAMGETFRHRHSVEVFNKGSPDQFLRQGEIDVLGLSRGEDGALSLVAVDVANHEKGLNYGPPPRTVARVLKKLIRSAASAQAYFPGIPAEVIFAAPNVGVGLLGELRPSSTSSAA